MWQKSRSLSPISLSFLCFGSQPLVSTSQLSLFLPAQCSSFCFTGLNVRWSVLPKYPHCFFLYSLSRSLKINLICGHLLFRTLTPYGQPPTQSTSSQIHKKLNSSHIKYWWSCILTGHHRPCIEFRWQQHWIITSWCISKDADLSKSSY